MRIYIIGNSEGYAFENARKFKAVQEAIEAQGHIAQNPFALIGRVNKDRKAKGDAPLNYVQHKEEILKLCFRALLKCDAVICLPCWANSEKSRAEHMLAQMARLKILTSTSFILDAIK